MRTSPDYQDHIEAKRAAIPIPDLSGKTVLDIGCDHGFWSWLSIDRGANYVLGIDRNREVRGLGFRNLVAENNKLARQAEYSHCRFLSYDIGKQWPALEQFDVVYLFSLYHHLFENCGDHNAIWYWLWRTVERGGQLLWENPVDCQDKVARTSIRPEFQPRYNLKEIMAAANKYFEMELIGSAIHEETRWVYRCKPRDPLFVAYTDYGMVRAGAGGASKAFSYKDGRRIDEIERILGFRPHPGSLNLRTEETFDFDQHYVRAEILDVVARGQGLDVEWKPRWCRFYPLTINGHAAAAMRFEGETYPSTMVEIIAPTRLRNFLGTGDKVKICRP